MKRRYLTPKAKAALWESQDRRCAGCRNPITLAEMQDDHEHPLWCGGDNEMDNRQGLCDDCHKPKTKCEAKARGKMKRLERIRLHGLKKPKDRKLESRGFDMRLRRKMSGRVEMRT